MPYRRPSITAISVPVRPCPPQLRGAGPDDAWDSAPKGARHDETRASKASHGCNKLCLLDPGTRAISVGLQQARRCASTHQCTYSRSPRRMRVQQSSARRDSATSLVTLPSMMGRCRKSSLSCARTGERGEGRGRLEPYCSPRCGWSRAMRSSCLAGKQHQRRPHAAFAAEEQATPAGRGGCQSRAPGSAAAAHP